MGLIIWIKFKNVSFLIELKNSTMSTHFFFPTRLWPKGRHSSLAWTFSVCVLVYEYVRVLEEPYGSGTQGLLCDSWWCLCMCVFVCSRWTGQAGTSEDSRSELCREVFLLRSACCMKVDLPVKSNRSAVGDVFYFLLFPW